MGSQTVASVGKDAWKILAKLDKLNTMTGLSLRKLRCLLRLT